jgi:hypothetical protein
MIADLEGILRHLIEIRAIQAAQGRVLDMLQEDVRMIRAAVNDLAKIGVTSGEIEAIHFDLNRLQRQFVELDTRVNKIESR